LVDYVIFAELNHKASALQYAALLIVINDEVDGSAGFFLPYP